MASGETLGAAVFRFVFVVGMVAFILASFNAGYLPSHGNNSSHGSGGQAVADCVITGVFLATAMYAWIRHRNEGRTHAEDRKSNGAISYDSWFSRAWMKPFLLLVSLASARGYCLFYERAAAPAVEAVLFACLGLSAVWLFIVGPMRRPVNRLLVLSDKGTYNQSGEHAVETSRGTDAYGVSPLAVTVRTKTFDAARGGYATSEVDHYLERLASELDHATASKSQWSTKPSLSSSANSPGFSRARLGYRREEVDGFLTQLAEDVQRQQLA